jgi:prepilin-type N-terminal cleavage/methylation domain-containing protein
MRKSIVLKIKKPGAGRRKTGVVIPHSAFRHSAPSSWPRGTPHSKGFTLIEIIIVIVLVGILATIAATIIMQGVRAYSGGESRSNAHYQARFAVERMSREIRLMRSSTVTDIPTMTGTTLRYTDINGLQMGFRLNAGNIERTEDNGASWQTLAIKITGPGGTIFTYLDNTGAAAAAPASLWLVQIQFTATQDAESINMHTAVHPRNF